jgi:hypothetical protein
MTLEAAWKLVQARGPAVVVVDRTGKTMPYAEAKARGIEMRCGYGDQMGSAEWDVLYIRDDGYSVCSSIYLAPYAEDLFKPQWIGMMRRGEKSPRPISFA